MMIWDQPKYPRWQRAWAIIPVDCDDGKTVWLQSFWMLIQRKHGLPVERRSSKPTEA